MEKKGAVKKEQENKKKKNQGKHNNNPPKKTVENNNSIKHKKPKKNKTEGEKAVGKNNDNPKSSGILRFFLFHIIVVSMAIGFLYLVDYEKFTKMKLSANAAINKTLGLLPPEVVAKGRNALELMRPPMEVVLSKLGAVAGGVSAFLNTNAIVRDHWIFAREVGSVCGRIFLDYLRTLYTITCRCWSKLIPSSAATN